MKGFMEEFKKFIMRGNVMDMAVGVIIGGAFQKIVTSLVGDVISPLLGVFSSANFDHLILKLGEVEVRYGAFITTVIDFLIMAFLIFLMIKGINQLGRFHQKEEEEAKPTTKVCPYCRSTVDLEAVRCPHCTSSLVEE